MPKLKTQQRGTHERKRVDSSPLYSFRSQINKNINVFDARSQVSKFRFTKLQCRKKGLVQRFLKSQIK